MAFDITPYIDKKPSEVRELIRQGVIDFPTAGMCRGYAQANLVILPPEYADDFEEYTKKNPFPCPVLEIIRGWDASVTSPLTEDEKHTLQALLKGGVAAAHGYRSTEG